MVRKTILLNCWPLACDIYKNAGNLPTSTEKKGFLSLSLNFHIKNDLMCVGMEKNCGQFIPTRLVLRGYVFTKCCEMVR